MTAPATTLELPGGPRAARQARRAVARHFGALLERRRLYELQVLVSEVVSNAVRHGGAADADHVVRLTMSAGEGEAQVRVCDSGPGFRRPADPRPQPAGGGNGLVVVQRLAERWDVELGRWTCVWFTYALS